MWILRRTNNFSTLNTRHALTHKSGGSDVDSIKSGASITSRNQSGAKTVFDKTISNCGFMNHCRVIHKRTTGHKNANVVCLHSEICRSNIGGSHKAKRDDESSRVKPGIYKGPEAQEARWLGAELSSDRKSEESSIPSRNCRHGY